MLKVIQCGLGAMGSLMARVALEKEDLELAGAVVRRAKLHGTDLGDYLGDPRAAGTRIYPDIATAAKDAGASVALLATGSFLADEVPIVEEAVRARMNVVSIAEEMAYPAAADGEAAARLDRLAVEHGVTVLGTGINPGFVLDLLIITLTGICRRIDRIYAERVNDLSPYGAKVMQTQGIGITPEAFARGLETGAVVGHIGFPQSVAMIADAVGIRLDEVRQRREPIIAGKRRAGAHITVEPGMVAGCRHTAQGLRDGAVLIELVHPQQVQPGAEGGTTWDLIRIEGDPNINLRAEPEMAGGIGTASIAVNMAPLVARAEPGLKSMKDLPVPRMAAQRGPR